MSAMSHQFDLSQSRRLSGAEQPEVRPIDAAALAAQWDAIHEAAAAVGNLAQLGEEPVDEQVRGLPERAVAMGGVNLAMVARGIDDLSAVLKPGLRALLELTGKGHDTTCAALTLWREFHNARASVIALVPAD
ncbi:hypothetical protein [Qipengyuania vesicularis]|uniref:hypothetical protein n=1 Tax=Qipengyuania vesicularis TaxID=2867232 RepID=UPI001C87E7BF|nr:hypothetical protein [Qipengyuania vesicularis]MBX7528158.1 hypothetical protein [Qipengyuania vesicularis]